ncbi:MAG: hypothetical protein HGA27_02805 [Peptococcaceae bacterium]|nr:hypothetical protein [Peptococcaceae bacterium]
MSIKNFFDPLSVAIIGASRTPGKISNAIMKNLIASGYLGNIYPINPKDDEIENIKAYSSVDLVPEKIDLAVIAVPAVKVIQMAEECGKVGVRNLVVVTAGFKEVGKEGLDAEKTLLAICRKYNMRMLGPNCAGMMDTHTPINTSFAKGFPLKGNIAFFSQSGAMLVSILDWSYQVGLGF